MLSHYRKISQNHIISHILHQKMVNEKQIMLNLALGVYRIRQLETEVVCVSVVCVCVCVGGGVEVYDDCVGMGMGV